MRHLFLLLPVVFLCHCGVPQPPACHSLPFASRGPADVVLENAKRNWTILADPGKKAQWPAAELEYNKALGILFDKLRSCGNDWPSQAAALGTAISEPSKLNENRLQRAPGLGIPAAHWPAPLSPKRYAPRPQSAASRPTAAASRD
ncbi:MAG: hypothetical protein OSA84_01035 [Akkermansiaceae bacterium]|nr:hypothetical protein [Akkermansiaceae bacterium]